MGKWPKEKMERWVTVYTDAGWKDGYAKTGFIARGTVQPVWHHGSGTMHCDNVQAAEAFAVLHALQVVGRVFTHPRGLEGFFVRSDNKHVVEVLQTQCRGYAKRERALRQLSGDLQSIVADLFAMCERRQWTILAKHVLAHGREPDRIRRWMNSRADRLGNLRGVEIPKPTRRQPGLFDDLDRLLVVEETS